ncbi:hypothetical protein X975_02977, partial [Stegodyphus mimosarum]
MKLFAYICFLLMVLTLLVCPLAIQAADTTTAGATEAAADTSSEYEICKHIFLLLSYIFLSFIILL